MESTRLPIVAGASKEDNRWKLKPLNFKLNRQSIPRVECDYKFTRLLSENFRYSSNSEIKDSANKKRKYSLGSHLMPRSIRFHAFMKTKNRRNGSSNSLSPCKQLLDYETVSLNSINIKKILSNDSEETSLNSTVGSVVSEFSRNSISIFSESSTNDLTSECSTYDFDSSANDRSSFNLSQISSNCNSTVDSSCDKSLEEEIEDTFDYENIKDDVVPIFAGYQLIGDSQLLRFSQKILGLQRDFSQTSAGSLGLCVSGQTISDLHRRVLDEFHPVSEQAILLIGTNDLLKGTTSVRMRTGLKFLIQDLLQSAKKIVILTLPPVPKLSYRDDHWTRMDAYNEYIKSLPERYYGKVTVADISPLFFKSSTRTCRSSYFERFFYGGKRKDLIHINEKGFNIIKKFLLKRL